MDLVADVITMGCWTYLVPDHGYSFADAAGRKGPTHGTSLRIRAWRCCVAVQRWGGAAQRAMTTTVRDLFIANGDPHHLYVEESTIARNDGKGRFVDVANKRCFFQQEDRRAGSGLCGISTTTVIWTF